MDYKIGDKVVYPNHGVGVVEQISYGVLNGRTERYFMIRIVSSGLRVMVPQSNAMTVGLRSVIRSTESTKVLGFLEKGKLNSHHDWKHRFKENSERMRTGALLEVAVVLKSLVSLSRSKPLSFREKKMLERAKYLLVSEMATSRNTTAEHAEATLVQSLARPRKCTKRYARLAQNPRHRRRNLRRPRSVAMNAQRLRVNGDFRPVPRNHRPSFNNA